MALRKVALLGNPVLRQEAKPVEEADIKSPKIQHLIQDMVETMVEYEGRGLAAPQVHESLQILVMLWDFGDKNEPEVICLINPEIKVLDKKTTTSWEGCLSLPGLRGKVSRPAKISVQAFNQEGEKVDFVAEGFAATVVQHEYDHLIGKLYVDRMEDFTQFSFEKEHERFHMEGLSAK